MLARFIVLALLGVGLVGCTTPPVRYSLADLASDEVVEAVAGEYWQRNDAPSLRRFRLKRVAISEFAVEFVTLKSEALGESQLAVNPPPLTPIGLILTGATEISGVGRKTIEYGPGTQQHIADALLAEYVESLEEIGAVVVMPAEVAATTAYRDGFKTVDSDAASDGLQLFNQIASDTGRVQGTRTFAPQGVRVIVGTNTHGDTIEDVEHRIIDEVNADASLRVRIRVGVFRGHASVDKGTRIWVLADDVEGSVHMTRPLLSEPIILTDKDYDFFTGTEYQVESSAYIEEVVRIFDAALRMAHFTGLDAE